MDTFRRIIPSQWLAPLNPPPFRLLDLPTELRYMVYAEVIKSQATLRKGYTRPRSIDDSSAVPDATTPCYIIDRSALSLVNRKIRGEFLHALQFTLPEEIRVDIRDAEFSPLKQFDIRARYWRKYLENGTRIKAVLHYDPNAISIAFFWGFEGAEFITRYHRLTDRIKISYEVAVRKPTFFQHMVGISQAIQDLRRLCGKIFGLSQPARGDVVFSFMELSMCLRDFRQGYNWNARAHTPDMRGEMYALVEAAIEKADRRRVISAIIEVLVSITLVQLFCILLDGIFLLSFK